MAPPRVKNPDHLEPRLSFSLPKEERQVIRKAAAICDMTIKDYCRNVLNERSLKIITEWEYYQVEEV